MKILITGATGFVGSHLCEYLLAQGHDIHGTYIYPQEVERFPDHLDLDWARANLIRVWRAQAPKRVLKAYDDAQQRAK